MNDEQLLALMLTALGVTTASALLMRERMTPPELWYDIYWPERVDEASVTAFLRTLAGDRSTSAVAFEIVASGGTMRYRVGLARRHAPSVISALRSFVPGVDVALIKGDVALAPSFAWTVHVSSRLRPLRTTESASIARGLIAALATTDTGETLTLQWLLGPRLSARAVASKASRPTAGFSETAKALLHGTPAMDNDERKALIAKVGEAGFRVLGRIAVAGASEKRSQALASRVTSALRVAETPGVSISVKRSSPLGAAHASVPREWPLSLNVSELTALTAFPLGDAAYIGIRGDGATTKPAPAVATRGVNLRIVGESTHPSSKGTSVGQSTVDALQHLHVLGPTGVGKSTLLQNLILQDIGAGRGVVVIDPKGDLVSDVLARVPAHRHDDVVVLDPADDQRPVGINVMGGGNSVSGGAARSPELIADQVLAVFHGLYADNWGPRTQDILHASLLTLAGRPGMTLCALPVLLSNEQLPLQVSSEA